MFKFSSLLRDCLSKEMYYIDYNMTSLKVGRPSDLTEEERAEKKKEYRRNYYREYNKQERVRKLHYQRMKKYRLAKKQNDTKHIENLKEYNKNYYEKNKEKYKEVTYCLCGGVFERNNKNRHINKTKKHAKWLSDLSK